MAWSHGPRCGPPMAAGDAPPAIRAGSWHPYGVMAMASNHAVCVPLPR